MIEQVYSALVEAGNRSTSKLATPPSFVRRFEAEEENRAGSLREILFGRRADAANVAASGVALERLQREEAQALRTRDARAQDAVRATRAEIVRAQHCRRRLPIPPPPACWNARGPRSIPTRLCSASTWATRFPGCGRWTGTGWASTFCRRASGSSLRSKPRHAPSGKIRRNPDRPARICTAPFSGRWMPGFDAGRAGCWLLTKGFSTCPVAALLESTRPRPVYVRSGAPRWSSRRRLLAGDRDETHGRASLLRSSWEWAIPSTMGPTRAAAPP